MNPQEIEKIKKFIADRAMKEAVYETLLNEFIYFDKNKDTQFLAAQMIAVNLLKDGFKELARISRSDDKPEKELSQIGL